MKINQAMLQQAESDGILHPGQEAILWAFLEKQTNGVATFNAAHIFYYLGGVIAILAMSLFMTAGYELMGPLGIAGIAFVYGSIGLVLAERYYRAQQPILTGIFAAFFVTQVPLLVFGLLFDPSVMYQSYHITIKGQWLFLELATLAAAACAFHRYRIPFLLMPVSFTLWYMGMDIVPALWDSYSWEFREGFAVVWGLLIVAFALLVDVKNKRPEDFAFWFYFTGLLSFTGGMLALCFSQSGSSEIVAYSASLILHFLLIMVGVALARKQFVVFGGIGMFSSLSYFAFDLLESNEWWWVLLCLAGFLIIYAGGWWQRHGGLVSSRLQAFLPRSFRDLVERRACS